MLIDLELHEEIMERNKPTGKITQLMMVDLRDRVAVVTGGGTGIGRAISLGLARCGVSVVVNYRRSQREAEDTVRDIKASKGKATAIQADLTKECQVKDLMANASGEYGRLDILVANAGGRVGMGRTEELPEQQWDAGLSANCKSVFLCVKHAIPRLSSGTGRVIVTSSISARSGAVPEAIAYAAAKGALNNMVRCWAKDLAARQITVNAIAPGVICTRIHEELKTKQDACKEIINRIPLGRLGQPEDCVGAVLLLASDEGGYIAGQTIEINGGMLMP